MKKTFKTKTDSGYRGVIEIEGTEEEIKEVEEEMENV